MDMLRGNPCAGIDNIPADRPGVILVKKRERSRIFDPDRDTIASLARQDTPPPKGVMVKKSKAEFNMCYL